MAVYVTLTGARLRPQRRDFSEIFEPRALDLAEPGRIGPSGPLKKKIYLLEHNFYGKGNCFNLSASYTVTICKGKVKATQFSMRLLKTNRACVPASPHICRINRLVFIKRRRFKRPINILLQNNCPSNLLTITYLLHVNWLNNIWVYKTISVEF